MRTVYGKVARAGATVAHTALVAGAGDYVVAAPMLPFQKPFFDQVEYVLVDRANGGAAHAFGNFFERGTPLLCPRKVFDELEDFLLAASEVGFVHTFIIKKMRILSSTFCFFLKKFLGATQSKTAPCPSKGGIIALSLLLLEV
jgi:hypothetical protein